MAYWWVNHKRTRDEEVQGGFLWSPLRKSNGRVNATYDTMALAASGDIVFSYANGKIRDYAVVLDRASPSPKPSVYGTKGGTWADEGWLLPVSFHPVPTPFAPKEHMAGIADLLPAKHAPIQSNGNGNQGVYLAGISDALGALLGEIGNLPNQSTTSTWNTEGNLIQDLDEIDHDVLIPDTERFQLRKARMGQGLFRTRVLLQEPRCRVTGVADAELLRASHIKPWRESSSMERLDGSNGLMLAPHVDLLFDRFLISFKNTGEMLVSTTLDSRVLTAWHIYLPRNVGPFSKEQASYLSIHRDRLR